jgi:hypothetical protein
MIFIYLLLVFDHIILQSITDWDSLCIKFFKIFFDWFLERKVLSIRENLKINNTYLKLMNILIKMIKLVVK